MVPSLIVLLLFLIYISDLPDGVVNSTVRLFADDCIFYPAVPSETKRSALLHSNLLTLKHLGEYLADAIQHRQVFYHDNRKR